MIEQASVITAKGSLHWETTQRQDPDESLAVNRVVFTSESEVQDLNDVSPTSMYIAHVEEMRLMNSRIEEDVLDGGDREDEEASVQAAEIEELVKGLDDLAGLLAA